MFNYIFANYKKSTDPDIIKSHNTAFDFYRELGLSPPDPSIIDGQNEWFKRYKVISILRIDRYLKQNLTTETNWNAVSDVDKNNCRIAIVQFIDWLLRNGQESSISITGSIAGQSFSKNTNLAKFELPPDVLISLEKVSFFSPLTPPAKLAASNFSKSQIDQIKAVFYDLFFSNYPATAEVLANKLLENTIFLNKIQGPQGATGLKGDKGDKGDQGIKGDKGDTGSQGLKGDKGDTGSQGPKGDKGDKGSQGLKGDKGDTGSQGPKGDKGDTGSQGLKGDKGDTGSQGPKGDKGDKGSQGPKGDKGATGGKVEKYNVNNNTLFSFLGTNIKIGDIVNLIFDNSVNNSVLHNKIFIGEMTSKYDGDELFVGKLWNVDLTILYGHYTITTAEVFNNGVGTDKINWSNTQKISSEELKALKANTYTKIETDTKLALKATKTALNAQKTDLEAKIALKRNISDSYTKKETDQKIAKLEGSGIDLHKIIPFQNEIEIATDVIVSIPHFTWPSATDLTASKNYYSNTFAKYGLVVGDYFKMTFPTAWTLSLFSSDDIKVAGKTFTLKLTRADNIGNDYILAKGYENGDTTKQGYIIDFGDYNRIVLYSIINTTISADDWKPYGNVSATNKFIRYIDYEEQAQSKKRLAQYSRERATIESVLAIGSGVIYTKLATALAPKTVHIDGHRMGWVRNDIPPVWSSKRLTLNAWKGWDWTALKNSGETNIISGYTQAKRFYKGDKLNLYIDAHISTFDRQGIFLIFKDKNGTLLTISARKYQNWWLGSNEFARATNTLNCDQAAVVQHNPQKNTYFKISHFEIKFENSAIFVETQSIMDNDTDINHTISHATINYPVGFLDDGIEFVGIELNRTNWINGTNSLNGTIKTSNNNNYQFKFDSQIIIKESTFNKQLAATKGGVKLQWN